ncbi:MAG: hypothetical protein OXT09_32930 [Myxococcales bacterium]|nr:hypothetical protein [Myxococcales bacterium]
MLKELPGWVVDDETSVREEVADWIGLSPQELWRLAHACARDAMWAASMSGMKQRILEHTDPLPESTVAALKRLRREAGWPRDV